MTLKDYIVAVPSYHRAEICNKKTLSMLHKNRIPKEKIYVYVANKEEYNIYSDTLNKDFYHKIVVGVVGIGKQREFIMDQWPEGKYIVFLDDDIESTDLSLSPSFKSKNLNYFIETAFKECVNHKAFIWGVYPVFNPFFRKARKELTTDLKFICGAFYGIINRPKLKDLELTITRKNCQKGDTERTLKYYIHDGKVVRFDKVGFVTKYFGTKGGMGDFNARLAPMKEATMMLHKKYPDYGRIKVRKNGMYEFVLYPNPHKKQTQKLSTSTKNKTKKQKNGF